MKLLQILSVLLVSILPVAARLGSRPDENIIELLKTYPDKFSTLVTLLEDNNLNDTLATGGNFTLFAPTNIAFEKVASRLGTLTPEQVVEVLKYHVVAGKALSSDLTDGQQVPTLREGSNLAVTIEEKTWLTWKWTKVYINDISVVIADIKVSNGVIHVIEEVLLPDDLNPNTIADVLGDYQSLSKLKGLLDTYNLTDTIKNTPNLTLIAPTNMAFKKIENVLARFTGDDGAAEVVKILTYHVLPQIVKSDDLADGQSYDAVYPGDKVDVSITEKGWWKWKWTEVKFEDSRVLKADIDGSNGVIHIVDDVMIPESVTIPNTVVDVAVGMGKLSTLVDLLNKFNLSDTLKGTGPFTVFAPTNDAFSDIESTLEGLNDTQVTNVLLYHVVNGKVLSDQLTDGQVVDTLYPGNSVTVSIEQKGGWRCKWFGYGCKDFIKINESDVKTADVDADNGVIHILNKVLIPANL